MTQFCSVHIYSCCIFILTFFPCFTIRFIMAFLSWSHSFDGRVPHLDPIYGSDQWKLKGVMHQPFDDFLFLLDSQVSAIRTAFTIWWRGGGDKMYERKRTLDLTLERKHVIAVLFVLQFDFSILSCCFTTTVSTLFYLLLYIYCK